MNEEIKKIKDYAKINKVPIISDSGLNFLLKYIKDNNVEEILEIGTAIGYSAIMMCSIGKNINVTTIERDEKRYMEALKNIKRTNLEDRIELIYNDAANVKLDKKFDLIFIDAAKAQNRNFFERFEKNLEDNGTIITDNMNFHGLVDTDLENIESRNLRGLVRKIKEYRSFLELNDKYDTEFLNLGDGIAVSKRRED